MDIYGQFDRLLKHAAAAQSWLDRNSVTEAKAELEKVVRPDGSYKPDGEARRDEENDR